MHLIQLLKELSLQPQSTQELRWLILDLAIRGRLTKEWREEHTEVEPAGALLERIETKTALLVKNKKIKKQKPVEGIKEEEITFQIPKQWTWCRLAQLGIINPRNTSEDKTTAGFVPMKNISESYGKAPIIEERPWGEIKKGYTHLQERDVAFAKITPCFENSKAAIFNGLPNAIGAGTTELHVFRPITEDSVSEFVYLLFKSPSFIYEGEKLMTGSAGQKRVPKSYVVDKIVPLPPLAEQKAIVEIVDQLLAEVDALEQQLQQRVQLKEDYVTAALRQLTRQAPAPAWAALQPHFKNAFDTPGSVEQLRQAILQLAVQGKLTAPWRQAHPDTEPASVLLEQIQAEKARLVQEKQIKKQKPLPPIEAEEVPFALPEGWVWCRLGEVVTILNGYAFKSTTYVEESDFQVIRLGNVKNNEFKLDTKQAFVPRDIGHEASAYELKENDILITLTGTRLKRDYCYTCLVESKHIKERTLLLNQRVGCIRHISPFSPFLANVFLKAPILLDELFETETGTANQGNIGSTALKLLLFPLPPLAEQKAIVALVDDLLGACDRLQAGLVQREVLLGDLMKASVREVRN